MSIPQAKEKAAFSSQRYPDWQSYTKLIYIYIYLRTHTFVPICLSSCWTRWWREVEEKWREDEYQKPKR